MTDPAHEPRGCPTPGACSAVMALKALHIARVVRVHGFTDRAVRELDEAGCEPPARINLSRWSWDLMDQALVDSGYPPVERKAGRRGRCG